MYKRQVKDGKLVKVEGDPEDPYNQGRLCSRCLCIPDYVYHEDRLVKPMKRDRADRGKDKFVECSWDEAYDIIVREFKRVVDTYGADKIAMCQGTGRDIHQVTRLNACVGSPNEGVPYFAGNSCYLPRIASMACMLGGACVMDCSQFLPKRYDDPRYTVPEYCIVWGHQPFYSNADGFYGHWITDLMKRGMKAVSYTHLDVYKRQIPPRAPPPPRPRRRPRCRLSSAAGASCRPRARARRGPR